MEENWIYGDDERYAYAIGRIRAMETRMLGRGKIENMVDARDINDVLRILGDSEYFRYLSSLEDPWNFEEMLLEENRRVLDTFRELSLDEEINRFYFLRHDFHNLKAAMKEHYTGQENPAAYSSLGTLDTSLLQSAMNEEFHLLPSPLEEAARNADESFAEQKLPSSIDNAVDRVMYNTYLNLATGKRYLFLVGLVRLELDLHNIQTVFRIRKKKNAKRLLGGALLEEGDISHDFFSRIIDESDESIIAQFENTPYREYVAAAGGYLKHTGSFLLFEKMYREELIRYLRRANLISFGIEPLVAYLYGKENEIRMIRIVMVGKLNGLSSDLIRENITNVYL
jgi:V/A-type H+-transporting ATPase subunit C